MFGQRLAAGLLSLQSCGMAWDTDGHAAVGMTIMSGVREKTLSHLKRLLGGKDVVDFAAWSPSIVAKYPKINTLFHQQQVLVPSLEVANCTLFRPYDLCPKKNCLLGATQYFYSQLARIDSDVVKDFEMPEKLQLSDTDKLKFLVACISELHNPVRFGYAFNNNGKNVSVQYVDKGLNVNTSLYDYWDSRLIQMAIRDRSSTWFSGWTHHNTLGRRFFEMQQKIWTDAKDESKFEVLRDWAAETWQTSCIRVQRKFVHGQRQGSVKTENELLIPDKYSISSSKMLVDFEYVKGRILIGGVRGAIVLNSIFEQTEIQNLRAGSGIQIQLEQKHALSPDISFKSRSSSIAQWSTNFAINLMIVLAVLTIFVAFIKYTSSGSPQIRSPVTVLKAKKSRD